MTALSHGRVRSHAPGRRHRITAAEVRTALEDVADTDPRHIDQPAGAGLPARYIANGRPDCLVARVLVRLGFSVGVLRALDEEYPVGELCAPGVHLAESRHPALRKLDPLALRLLDYVQNQSERGVPWGRIVARTFATTMRVPIVWKRNRPWLARR